MSGCQRAPENNRLKVYPTTGKLMINGVPANGAIVRLYPVNSQTGTDAPVVPSGVVREDGTFELTSYDIGDGAPDGEYHVTFVWPDPKLLPPAQAMTEDPPDRMSNRFATPEKSTLKVNVAAGKNELEPFAVDNVKIRVGSSAH